MQIIVYKPNYTTYVYIVSSADSSVVRSNIDVLVSEGLGPRAEEDLLLARETCLTLLKLTSTKKVNIYKNVFAYFLTLHVVNTNGPALLKKKVAVQKDPSILALPCLNSFGSK